MQTGVSNSNNNLTNMLWKQNNGNLKYVLKQDSSYSLWLDYLTYHQACVLETFFCVSDHIMGFSLPRFRYELLSLK